MLGSVTCNHLLLRELILHDPLLHIYVFHGGNFKVLQSGRDLLFPLRVIKLVAREFPDQEPVSRFFMRPQLTFCKNSFSVTFVSCGQIRTHFYSCHDSLVVLTCAKSSLILPLFCKVTTTFIFSRFRQWAKKAVVKWVFDAFRWNTKWNSIHASLAWVIFFEYIKQLWQS